MLKRVIQQSFSQVIDTDTESSAAGEPEVAQQSELSEHAVTPPTASEPQVGGVSVKTPPGFGKLVSVCGEIFAVVATRFTKDAATNMTSVCHTATSTCSKSPF